MRQEPWSIPFCCVLIKALCFKLSFNEYWQIFRVINRGKIFGDELGVFLSCKQGNIVVVSVSQRDTPNLLFVRKYYFFFVCVCV